MVYTDIGHNEEGAELWWYTPGTGVLSRKVQTTRLSHDDVAPNNELRHPAGVHGRASHVQRLVSVKWPQDLRPIHKWAIRRVLAEVYPDYEIREFD